MVLNVEQLAVDSTHDVKENINYFFYVFYCPVILDLIQQQEGPE